LSGADFIHSAPEKKKEKKKKKKVASIEVHAKTKNARWVSPPPSRKWKICSIHVTVTLIEAQFAELDLKPLAGRTKERAVELLQLPARCPLRHSSRVVAKKMMFVDIYQHNFRSIPMDESIAFGFQALTGIRATDGRPPLRAESRNLVTQRMR